MMIIDKGTGSLFRCSVFFDFVSFEYFNVSFQMNSVREMLDILPSSAKYYENREFFFALYMQFFFVSSFFLSTSIYNLNLAYVNIHLHNVFPTHIAVYVRISVSKSERMKLFTKIERSLLFSFFLQWNIVWVFTTN